MSQNESDIVLFNSVELLSLYTTMVLKRLTTTALERLSTTFEARLKHLVDVLEYNLGKMKVERKWFFGTLRDHARLFHHLWSYQSSHVPDKGLMGYNTLLLVVALKLGLEKVWVSDGCTPLHTQTIMEELNALYKPGKPTLCLKQLSQCHSMFEYLANHSPGLEELYMPRSDATSFQNCMKFKNLRVLELAGRVPDKVLCNALWNVNKKSDKVLEMALKDTKQEPESWQLSLPHLETLRNNVLQMEMYLNTMRLSLGSAALLIQPKMQVVEALCSWDTFGAILHLLNIESKLKNSSGNDRKFQVTHLAVHYHPQISLVDLERVMRACPKLHELTLNTTENIHLLLSEMVAMIPVKQLKTLHLDASTLNHMEFTVLLAHMPDLNHLTLRVTPRAITNFKGYSTNVPLQPDMLPKNLDTLGLDFTSNSLDMEVREHETQDVLAKDMLTFLSSFPSVKNLYFYNTLFLPAPYLVYGCLGGSLGVLPNLKHLSVISCNEDIPREAREITEGGCDFDVVHSHYTRAPDMLPDLQNEATFKHLCSLTSLELDEFYLSPKVDRMVENLRVAGVLVAIHYRLGKIRYPSVVAGRSRSARSQKI